MSFLGGGAERSRCSSRREDIKEIQTMTTKATILAAESDYHVSMYGANARSGGVSYGLTLIQPLVLSISVR